MNSFILFLSFLERRFYLFTQLASFAVALHLSRRRTNTRTRTHWHTFVWLCISIVSDKDSAVGQGVGESAARAVQFETQQSYAAWYDAESQTWETHRSRCTGVEFIFFCCCYFYSIIFCAPPTSLSPSLPPSSLSFHYFAQIFELHKEKELGSPYTRPHIYEYMYMTGSICLLQLTAA